MYNHLIYCCLCKPRFIHRFNRNFFVFFFCWSINTEWRIYFLASSRISSSNNFSTDNRSLFSRFYAIPQYHYTFIDFWFSTRLFTSTPQDFRVKKLIFIQGWILHTFSELLWLKVGQMTGSYKSTKLGLWTFGAKHFQFGPNLCLIRKVLASFYSKRKFLEQITLNTHRDNVDSILT